MVTRVQAAAVGRLGLNYRFHTCVWHRAGMGAGVGEQTHRLRARARAQELYHAGVVQVRKHGDLVAQLADGATRGHVHPARVGHQGDGCWAADGREAAA